MRCQKKNIDQNKFRLIKFNNKYNLNFKNLNDFFKLMKQTKYANMWVKKYTTLILLYTQEIEKNPIRSQSYDVEFCILTLSNSFFIISQYSVRL